MSGKQQTIRVEIGAELMKFVVGYDLANLKELRERFPALKINNGKRAIYIEGTSVNLLDSCKSALDDIIVKAISDKSNSNYKKRIEKAIEAKRRAAAASNRIRDNIETELKTKQINDITERLSDKIGITTTTSQPSIPESKSGMFAGLDIESSGDEAE
jgi:uncharacterized membrane protein YheB (UPF0754 family)